MRTHYQEFVRLEINGVWYRVSDYEPFRHHARLTFQGPTASTPFDAWLPTGVMPANVADNNNNGW
jgi:hypothetical protein